MIPSLKNLGILSGVLLVAASGQAIIHAGEDLFVITVRGGEGVTFHGDYLGTGLAGESNHNKAEGAVPAKFTIVGTGVYLSLQNQSPSKEVEIRVDANGNRQLDPDSPSAKSGPFLEVEISKNGTTIKKQRTDATYGVVTLASTKQPATGRIRQSEYRVEGSVKFAMLTLTSDTGDIEQQLVPIPFTKPYYPREGWIVGLSAQKMRVTRIDPFSTMNSGPITQVLDDGVKGSVHVSIRVNGAVIGEAEVSDPHGIAGTTVRIP